MRPLANARSIQAKLSLILLATVGVALAIAAASLLVFEARNDWRSTREALVSQADVVGLASEAALSFQDPAVAAQNLRALQAQPSAVGAALYDASGRLFASYQPADPETSVPPPPRAPRDGVAFGWTSASVVRPVVSNRERIGSVFVQVRHGLLARLAEYLGWLFAVMLASLAGAVFLARRLQSALTGPIEEVSSVARGVLERGVFDMRARRTSDDEVGQLVDGFNAMLDELGRRSQVLQHANAALSASEARYQLAVRGSSAGLWDWDLEAGTMFHSPRLKALLGYSEEEFPDTPEALPALMHPQDLPAVRTALQDHLAHDTPYQAECRLREKSGQWRWFLIAGTAQRNATGRPFRMAGSLIDITERKESELLLQHANRAKDEFLATLAHELRNPLAPLRTGLQILKSPGATQAMARRTLDTMDRQLTHMVRLVDDLLDISRISSGKIRLELARTSLRAALQTSIELARPAMDAAGHALHVDLPQSDLELEGDATRLAQAFGNLLNNAAKYTPPGGRISLRAWRAGEQAVVEIADNGIGIPREMLEQVFNLFAQVTPGAGQLASGLGIGLFLVRTLVEMHGGTVIAASAGAGQGSTFTVSLPCLPPAPTPAPIAGAEARDGNGGSALRVLVVDDNVDAADTLATFLEMTGIEARAVHDGLAAVPAALDFRPDLVLLDIGLPGMNGYEVARALRAQPTLARTVLVALTGWGTEEDRRKAMEAGFDQHLTKPVDLNVLQDVLQRLTTPSR